MPRKLVLVVVDALRTDMLEMAAASGSAPTFAELLDRGTLVRDCVSSFPSVTPVCTSEITTGRRPDEHRIPGMNWYHRAERRYVEYGSSWEATRTFGLFGSLYDTVYNMNMGHLSAETLTLYERLGDAGIRSACTPFLIYRGRTRHELGLEGMLRTVATTAKFHHAVWGPDELFYGELYASRRVPCKPTLARPDARDDYSACVGSWMVERDLFDFMLFSLPDNDHHSHKLGPEASEPAIAHADECFSAMVEAAGGLDAFLKDHAVILMADHAQTDVEHALPLASLLGERWRVLQPNSESPERAELAVGPSARAAGVWVLRDGDDGRRLHAATRERLAPEPGVDLLLWLEDQDGEPIVRDRVQTPEADVAVIQRQGRQLRFQPGSAAQDRRDRGWSWDGEEGVLGLTRKGDRIDFPDYPDAFARIWGALHSPYAADLMVSATLGFELVDWGGMTHIPGGSHGSLHARDSLAPLLTVGLDPEPEERDQWAISDVYDLILGHFGLDSTEAGEPAMAGRGAP